MCRSVPQIPLRSTRINTSLMPVFGTGTSSSERPSLASRFTSAFMVFIVSETDLCLSNQDGSFLHDQVLRFHVAEQPARRPENHHALGAQVGRQFAGDVRRAGFDFLLPPEMIFRRNDEP